MPTPADYDAIIARLNWSWDHLQRYKARLVGAQVRYHWTMLPKVKTKSGYYIDIVVDEAAPIPDDVKFIIGDCVHSLRASLDNLIYSLCPPGRGKHAEFVLADTRADWRRWRYRVKCLPYRAFGTLYKLQPFHPQQGPDPKWNALWVLNRLWNDDKHRAPHVAMGVADAASIDAEVPIFPVFCSGPLELDAVVARVWFWTDTEPDLQPHLRFDIAFDEGGPARGGSVYYSLWNLHDIVRQVVALFKHLFTDDPTST